MDGGYVSSLRLSSVLHLCRLLTAPNPRISTSQHFLYKENLPLIARILTHRKQHRLLRHDRLGMREIRHDLARGGELGDSKMPKLLRHNEEGPTVLKGIQSVEDALDEWDCG